jgi:SAM-dependent methyltransferase
MHRVKQNIRDVWMAGDFGKIAKGNVREAEAFVGRLDLPVGAKVLDVACGTGNVSLPLARRGARVTGVDIAPNLLAQARERARAEGLEISFEEGDAEQLPYPDSAFDAVITMFGAMFAPQPERVVAECARVLKVGGQLAMANFTPGGFAGRMFQLTARHVGTPMGIAPPAQWGHPMVVRGRLAPSFDKIELDLIPMQVDFPGSPAQAVMFFRTWFGPTNAAFNSLDEDGQARLAADLEDLWAEGNTAPDPATRTLIENEYLQVVARRKS